MIGNICNGITCPYCWHAICGDKIGIKNVPLFPRPCDACISFVMTMTLDHIQMVFAITILTIHG